ncbi:hypothetical protein [Muribaculum intestinale]|uniref:hypothetical protein n=1 Tax=Muribaculum intestinale TaxID=1796646 RepID=UPI0013691277|nr:hypothetical protein [Muribaculum intestinale]MYM12040.1 hypothetical protein [Muribaculum intestinale]
MSYFDTFIVLTLLEDIFKGVKELATSPETAKWFWCFVVGLIVVLSAALLLVSIVG